jgi:hypothetical protein
MLINFIKANLKSEKHLENPIEMTRAYSSVYHSSKVK